jgi:hypothetical protein
MHWLILQNTLHIHPTDVHGPARAAGNPSGSVQPHGCYMPFQAHSFVQEYVQQLEWLIKLGRCSPVLWSCCSRSPVAGTLLATLPVLLALFSGRRLDEGPAGTRRNNIKIQQANENNEWNPLFVHARMLR